MRTSPEHASREDGEMAEASPTPCAPLKSSASLPPVGIQVLVHTVNQQTLAHHQLATTLEVVGRAMGDMVAEIRAGRSSDTTTKGESLKMGVIPIFSGLSDALPVREWLHVMKSTLTATGVPTAGWVPKAMLRLSGEAQTLALTIERSAEQEGILAEFREWTRFEDFLTTQFGGLCPQLTALQKLERLSQGRQTVTEYVAHFRLLVSQIPYMPAGEPPHWVD
jgi:Retrotransposon gag protein